MLLKYISSCTEVKGTGLQKRIRNLSRALSAVLQKLRFICTSWKAVFPPSQGKSDPPPPWCPSPQLLPAEVAIPSSFALHNCFSNLNGLRKVSRKMLSPFSCPLTFEKAASKIETCLAKENSKVMNTQGRKEDTFYSNRGIFDIFINISYEKNHSSSALQNKGGLSSAISVFL